jgi:hypothetical protein
MGALETTDTLGSRWYFERWPVLRWHHCRGWRCVQDYVVIAFKYDNFTSETGSTLRDSAGTLIAGQSNGSISTEGDAVSKTTAYIAKGACTFEMNGTYEDRICGQYGAGEFNVIVNGEAGAISGSRVFRDVVRESFDVVGRSTGHIIDYLLDVAYDVYPYETS